MISLPPAFTERMQQLLGNESETFFQALVSESPTSIRLNPEKTANTDLPFSELLSRQVPWCSNGYYLKERPSFLRPVATRGSLLRARSLLHVSASRSSADKRGYPSPGS